MDPQNIVSILVVGLSLVFSVLLVLPGRCKLKMITYGMLIHFVGHAIYFSHGVIGYFSTIVIMFILAWAYISLMAIVFSSKSIVDVEKEIENKTKKGL